jgi:hypothetical protein
MIRDSDEPQFAPVMRTVVVDDILAPGCVRTLHLAYLISTWKMKNKNKLAGPRKARIRG